MYTGYLYSYQELIPINITIWSLWVSCNNSSEGFNIDQKQRERRLCGFVIQRCLHDKLCAQEQDYRTELGESFIWRLVVFFRATILYPFTASVKMLQCLCTCSLMLFNVWNYFFHEDVGTLHFEWRFSLKCEKQYHIYKFGFFFCIICG